MRHQAPGTTESAAAPGGAARAGAEECSAGWLVAVTRPVLGGPT